MGFMVFDVKEFVDILLKNVDIPDVVKKVEVNKNEVTVKIKPTTILPEIYLKFTITSVQNGFSILFDPSKSLIIYGFLFGKLKKEKVEGIQLFKDRLEIHPQKLLNVNLKGVKINKVEVNNDGKIEINFCCD
ncbi:hypothetical protein Calow_2236 [Caldicellulosiruptor owensensis OL]|uniref:DUF2993 domain-containing protein n=1 Tax=Caldicellulosiruptor owensensis (strain ATCC 700167 / DSM 13100 / OL) TaxID=632518 RepID=E4Q759_CALOW|nr:hypothetical protein [Caldicellulosiruptor owensensis]ADQ05739.1 hypothetical protein Calow_2236 [Caldicellulosiruptor owensensis OL]